MEITTKSRISKLLGSHTKEIIKKWLHEQMDASGLRIDIISEKQLQEQSSEFLKLFSNAIHEGNMTHLNTAEYAPVLGFLKELSSSRGIQGFSPTETATFIFSLKRPLFQLFNEFSASKKEDERIDKELWEITELLDKLGLYTMEEYQKTREKIIKQQQEELLELSTPVAKLWEGILVLPLIGTLDSARTQSVMENLLQKIVETASTVAIIDITGIPVVDTLVAQHLIKTMNAARLMGTECIISGIRPQIAQTIVHLGISMQDVITRATLADAVALAMKKAGLTVTKTRENLP